MCGSQFRLTEAWAAWFLLFFCLVLRVPFSGGTLVFVLRAQGRIGGAFSLPSILCLRTAFPPLTSLAQAFLPLVDPRVVVMGIGLLVSSRKFVSTRCMNCYAQIAGIPKKSPWRPNSVYKSKEPLFLTLCVTNSLACSGSLELSWSGVFYNSRGWSEGLLRIRSPDWLTFV